MEQDQPGLGVIEVHTDGQVTHRHHEDLEGDKVTGNEDEEYQQITLEPIDPQGKASHA